MDLGLIFLFFPGELRHIHKLRFWSLADVLHEKYRFPRAAADEIAAFITPMIDLNPDRRATAEDMLKNTWMQNVEIANDGDPDEVVPPSMEAVGRLDGENGTTSAGRSSGAEGGSGANRSRPTKDGDAVMGME